MRRDQYAERLRKLRADPAFFRSVLIIDTDRGPQPLARVVEPWQDDGFRALDAAWQSVVGLPVDVPHRRVWREMPRGHSKTTDAAVMLAYALFASPRKLSGIVAAADQEQAQLLRDAVAKLTQLNTWLAARLDVQRNVVRNNETESECRFISSDVASSFGATPDFLLCDEFGHWAKRELWDSLISAAAKRERCLVSVTTNAGWQGTWQWETRQAVRNSPEWHFSRLDGPRASWITPARLDEQRRLLPPVAFARLWLNEWAPEGAGDAFDPAVIESCCVLPGPAVGPEQGRAYVLGVDLGVRRDASAAVLLSIGTGWTEEIITRKPPPPHAVRILRAMNGEADEGEREYIRHEGDGRVRLCDCRVWRPSPGREVDLAAVENYIAETCKLFGAYAVLDYHQAASMIQRLQRAVVPCEGLALSWSSHQAIATAMMDRFRDRTVELYRDPVLLADLRALRVEENRYGFRLAAPRISAGNVGTAHADAGSAFSIALWGCTRLLLPTAVSDGPAVLWPCA